ncbi:MAG: hypothetical protein R3F62_07120 [Planctomycetota bacterium]
MRALLPLLLGLALAGCASEEPTPGPAPGPGGDAVAAVATFSHPQPLGFVWWSVPAGDGPLRVLEQRVELPPRPQDGVRLVLSQVQLRAAGAVHELQLAVHSDHDTGDAAATLSRAGACDPADARPASAGFEALRDAGLEVGSAFPWRPGTWIARLEWRRDDARGSWFGFTLRHEASGDFCDAGELRGPARASVQPVVGSWLSLTSGADVPGDVVPGELTLGGPRVDARVPRGATTTYGALRNVDVHLDAPRGEARIAWGGATQRRHAAGRFELP